MTDDLKCPNCNEAIETGAVFCGNCGFKLALGQAPQPATISQVYSQGPEQTSNMPLNTPAAAGPNIPAYAIAHHQRQHWAIMALALGILGLGISALIPVLGIGLGICGIVLITSSYRLTHGWLKLASIVICSLAVASGIGITVYNISHNSAPNPAKNSVGTSNGVSRIAVNTPCYSLSFNTELNVNNANGSCSMNAYNGTTFQSSSNVYKVLASQTTAVNNANFDNVSKQAISQDISKNLSEFSVTTQSASLFDGSPAYSIKAYDTSDNIAVIEEAIFHNDLSSVSRDNFFVIVHADSGTNINLNSLESSWQWND